MKVIEHYPDLAAEWRAMEARKGHGFMPIPLRLLPAELQRREDEKYPLFACSCFGGSDEEPEADDVVDPSASDPGKLSTRA